MDTYSKYTMRDLALAVGEEKAKIIYDAYYDNFISIYNKELNSEHLALAMIETYRFAESMLS